MTNTIEKNGTVVYENPNTGWIETVVETDELSKQVVYCSGCGNPLYRIEYFSLSGYSMHKVRYDRGSAIELYNTL